MKLSQEAKVGLLALVTLTMFFFGFNFLKGSNIFKKNKQFTVVYTNVDGLTSSNPVLLNGLTVGRVAKIDLLPEQGNKLLVTLDMNKDVVVRQGSKALLADGGLLGGKVIRLELNKAGSVMEEGELIAANEQGISALIKEKTLPVLSNVDSLTRRLNYVVASFDQTAAVLNQTLRGAGTVTGTLNDALNENRAGLRFALANVNQLSRSLDKTTQELSPILTKASTFTDSLNALQLRQTLSSANKSIDNLQKLLGNIEKGQGSLGKLTTDDSLYVNVSRTAGGLEKLLTDFRQNPKKYINVSFSVFGKKDKPVTGKPGSVTTTTVTTMVVDTTRK
ncbi:MlaD family protein [Fibrivirga algicola]|uniref:MCE family protein n=1 Tax=Fibrivirga algicola TaxID=2950420 RepID=A0ABX0QD59_9BACT|nr:MlaD family protein [Fibrivirga algicola]NID09878.1 MCE family protein [Fibrivirga algicola]